MGGPIANCLASLICWQTVTHLTLVRTVPQDISFLNLRVLWNNRVTTEQHFPAYCCWY